MSTATPTRPAGDGGSVYAVEGLTCGACLAEVMEAVRGLPQVTGVAVDLVVNGRSALMVRSDVAVPPQAVIESVHRVGFQAYTASRRRVRHLQRTFTRSAQDLDPRAAM